MPAGARACLPGRPRSRAGCAQASGGRALQHSGGRACPVQPRHTPELPAAALTPHVAACRAGLCQGCVRTPSPDVAILDVDVAERPPAVKGCMMMACSAGSGHIIRDYSFSIRSKGWPGHKSPHVHSGVKQATCMPHAARSHPSPLSQQASCSGVFLPCSWELQWP